MALINPIASSKTLTVGNTVLLYTCPTDKSHCIVTVNFFKNVDSNGESPASLIEVALSSESNPANLTSLDYFVDDIELSTVGTNAALSRIIVGRGEKLYGKLISGTTIVARVTGVEEAASRVLQAGKLVAVNVATPGAFTKVYENAVNGASYITSSVTFYNNSSTEARVDFRIGPDGAGSSSIDDVTTIFLSPNDTAIVANLMTKPNEKFWVKTSQANLEVFVNGLVVA